MPLGLERDLTVGEGLPRPNKPGGGGELRRAPLRLPRLLSQLLLPVGWRGARGRRGRGDGRALGRRRARRVASRAAQ